MRTDEKTPQKYYVSYPSEKKKKLAYVYQQISYGYSNILCLQNILILQLQ